MTLLPIHLNHPCRDDVKATCRLAEDGQVVIEVGIIDSPLFRISVSASTDVELYEALGLLVDTGFFSRRDLLHAIRWSQWFSPHQIHDEDVQRAAEVINCLRHLTQQSPQKPVYDRYEQTNRRRTAE